MNAKNKKLKIPREGVRSFAGYLYFYGVNITAVRGKKRGPVGANDSTAKHRNRFCDPGALSLTFFIT